MAALQVGDPQTSSVGAPHAASPSRSTPSCRRMRSAISAPQSPKASSLASTAARPSRSCASACASATRWSVSATSAAANKAPKAAAGSGVRRPCCLPRAVDLGTKWGPNRDVGRQRYPEPARFQAFPDAPCGTRTRPTGLKSGALPDELTGPAANSLADRLPAGETMLATARALPTALRRRRRAAAPRSRVSLTRGRPAGSPSARSWRSIACQPA